MVWPLALGLGIAGAALGGKLALNAMKRMRANAAKGVPGAPGATGRLRGRKFYEGGFESPMSKKEAALVLGCRESASKQKIMERYRTLMRLNHPDLGGSPLLTRKVNEAKELLHARAPDEDMSGGRRRARR